VGLTPIARALGNPTAGGGSRLAPGAAHASPLTSPSRHRGSLRGHRPGVMSPAWPAPAAPAAVGWRRSWRGLRGPQHPDTPRPARATGQDPSTSAQPRCAHPPVGLSFCKWGATDVQNTGLMQKAAAVCWWVPPQDPTNPAPHPAPPAASGGPAKTSWRLQSFVTESLWLGKTFRIVESDRSHHPSPPERDGDGAGTPLVAALEKQSAAGVWGLSGCRPSATGPCPGPSLSAGGRRSGRPTLSTSGSTSGGPAEQTRPAGGAGGRAGSQPGEQEVGAHRQGTDSHSSPHRRALQSPPRRPRPRRQVLWPEGGHCGGDKGPLVTAPLPGGRAQVEAGGERSSVVPPRCDGRWVSVPAAAPVDAGSAHSPAGSGSRPVCHQNTAARHAGVRHGAGGQPCARLQRVPRRGRRVGAKRASPQQRRAGDAEGAGVRAAQGLSSASTPGQLLTSNRRVSPRCPTKSQLPRRAHPLRPGGPRLSPAPWPCPAPQTRQSQRAGCRSADTGADTRAGPRAGEGSGTALRPLPPTHP